VQHRERRNGQRDAGSVVSAHLDRHGQCADAARVDRCVIDRQAVRAGWQAGNREPADAVGERAVEHGVSRLRGRGDDRRARQCPVMQTVGSDALDSSGRGPLCRGTRRDGTEQQGNEDELFCR
jgi:hypothetical protein